VRRESKVIRLLSIIHNGIILDLVCGFGGSVGEEVCAGFFSVFREKHRSFYGGGRNVRSDEPA